MRTTGVVVLVACGACGGKEIADIPPPPPEFDGGQASSDASTFADARGTTDALGDEGSAADAIVIDADALGAWCAANAALATFCDDFDAPNRPRLEWTTFGAGLDIVTSTSTSSPHALHAKTKSPSYLAFTIPTAPYGAKLEADFRVDADGTSGDMPVLLGIEAENGQTMDLVLVPGTNLARVVFAGYDGGPSFTEFSLPRDGAWHTLSMKISLGQNNFGFLCTIDGQDHSLWGLAGSTSLGKVTIVVGARGTTSADVEAYFDDVVIWS